MPVVAIEGGLISDSFEIGEYPYILNDAIVMPEEQYNALTEEDLISLKQQRYDNWYSHVTTVSEEVPVEVVNG